VIDKTGGAIVLGGIAWGGPHDCFVAQLSADGRQLRYATLLGGDVSVDAPQLAAPANGFAAGAIQTNVTLSWSAVNDPSGIEAYNYQMSSRPDFPDSCIQFRGSVSGTLRWRVRVISGAGTPGAWSNTQRVGIG
jgi:hypothetical protein